MTRTRLTSIEQLHQLPDGTLLTTPDGAFSLVWQRRYRAVHTDPTTGLRRLPLDPFIEYGIIELESDLLPSDPAADAPQRTLLRGDEPWLSTLDDPHDATKQP